MKESILKEAWRLRQTGIYTMRDIANKLCVNREQLIDELEAYLSAQSNNACSGLAPADASESQGASGASR